jgi:UDP-glucose 4-epimerase
MVGSAIAASLLRDGHTVIGLDNYQGGSPANIPDVVRTYYTDCRNEENVGRIFEKHKPEAVIHCAAYASENYSHWCHKFLVDNNVIGSAIILNACVNHGVKLLAFTSSIAVYGEPWYKNASPIGDAAEGYMESMGFACPFAEDTYPQPVDNYGIYKLATERSIEAASKMFGIEHAIFRCHNIIGERQNMADRTRNFVAIAIRHALEGKPAPIYGDGQQTRQFTPVSYVADCIAACVKDSNSWNQIYNVGVDTKTSIKTMAEYVSNACGVEPRFDFLPQRHEVVHAACDHSKLRQAFPDVPIPCLHDCIAAMVEEARSRPFQPYQEPPAAEITKNLPEWSKPK